MACLGDVMRPVPGSTSDVSGFARVVKQGSEDEDACVRVA